LLRIRLSRVGKKKQPSYRLVVADSRAPRDGAFIKIIGHYNPRTDPTTLVVKEDEAVEWLSRGAQPSDTVAKLLTRIGVMERAGRAPVVWDRKTPVKPKKEAVEEAPAAAPAAAAKEETPAKAEAPAEETKAEAEAAPEAPPAKAAPKRKAAAARKPKAKAEAPAEEAKAKAEAEPAAEAEGETPDESKSTE
jgi:small subunit ribosomal protein S16